MRTLKKTLCLVLCLAMMAGLCVFASADFKDQDKIENEEAVAVLTGIGVIQGDDKGNFNPEGTLTRAEATVIITKLLGAADIKATTDKFTDVTENYWGMPYIAYCVAEGIVAGMGDGTFAPNAKLTGYQWATLLLRALGYEVSGEAWEITVAKLLKETKLTAGLTFVGTEPISRDDACQMAFKALFIGTEYEKTETKYTVTGVSAEFNGKYTATTKYDTKSAAINAALTAYDQAEYGKDYIIDEVTVTSTATKDSLASTYFPNLKKTSATSDKFGRPCKGWYYGKTEAAENVIYTESAAPVVAYTEAVTGGKVYKDLGFTSATIGKLSATYIVNGKTTANTTEYADEGYAIALDNKNKIGGQGTLVEIFETDDYEYTIVVTETYVDTISTWTAAVKNSAGEITAKEKVHLTTLDKDFDTTDFSKQDQTNHTVVIYTKVWNGTDYDVFSVEAAKTEEVTVSSVSTSKFIGNGTTYLFSDNYVETEKIAYVKNAASTENDYVLYLDSYGNVITAVHVEAVEATTGYAVVLAVSNGGSTWSDGDAKYEAKLLLADGKTEIVETNAASYTYGESKANALVKYTITADGQYTFGSSDCAALAANTTLDITKGVAKFSLDAANDSTANAKTIFFVGKTIDSKITWKVVTGIANMDSIEDGSGTKTAALKTGSVANAVIVLDAESKTGSNTTEADIAYLIYNADAEETSDAAGTYKVYNAVIGGEITTVKVDKTNVETVFQSGTSNVLVASIEYNKDGLAVNVGSAFAANTQKLGKAKVTAAPKDGVVSTGSDYSIADDCAVYVIKNGVAVEGTLEDIAKDAHIECITTGGVITMIFVTAA